MASGNFTKYLPNNKQYIKVWWSSTPISGENASNVTVYAKFYSPYAISSTAKKKIKLTIDGTTYEFTKNGWGGTGWSDKFAEKTVKVTHNTDGKKTIKIKLYAEIGLTLSGIWYDDLDTGLHSCTLDNLQVKSTISLNESSRNVGQSITITLKRSSNKVRHRISVWVNDKQYYYALKKSDDTGSGSTYTFKLDADKFLPYMAGKTATIKVVCRTFKDSSATTYFGTDTKTFTLKVGTGYKPTLTANDVQIISDPISNLAFTDCFVKGKSQARIQAGGTPAMGTTIRSYKYTVTSPSGTSGSKTVSVGKLSESIIALSSAGAHTITIAAIDGRGLESDKVTKTFEVLPYNTPVVKSFEAVRCASDGTSSNSGTYVKISLDVGFSDCAGNNKLAINIEKCAMLAESEFTTVKTISDCTSDNYSEILSDFPTNNSYSFRVTITDLFGAAATYVGNIGTKEVLIDVAMKDNGIAIGKISERANAVEINHPAYFGKDIILIKEDGTEVSLMKTLGLA